MKKHRTTAIILITLAVMLAGGLLLFEMFSSYSSPSGKTPDGGSVVSGSSAVMSTGSAVSAGEKPDKKSAPDFTVYDSDGNEFSLSSLAGSPVIVNFWATWCGPCQKEMPHFEEAYKEYGDRVKFVMVNLTDGIRDTKKGVINYIEKNSFTFPYYLDTGYSAADAYAITSIPMTVLVGNDGSIFTSVKGTLTKEMLYDYIETLLKNEEK